MQPQMQPVAQHSSFWTILANAFLTILSGLIPMLMLALAVGLIAAENAFHYNSYFSGFGNALSVMVFVVPITIVFLLIALAIRDLLFATYPIIIFCLMSRETIEGVGLFNFISHSIPDITNVHRATFVAGVVVLYCVVYVIGRSAYHVWHAYKTQNSHKYQKTLAYVSVAVVTLALLLTALILGAELRDKQEAERTRIRLPATAEITASTPEVINVSFTEYYLRYPKATSKLMSSQSIHVVPLKEWWKTDTKTNCGGSLTSGLFPGQTATYHYATTPSGVTYAKAAFETNSSNPPLPENAYKEYYYCFVLDYQRYTLTFSDRNGLAILKKYPVEMVIDTIAHSTRYAKQALTVVGP